MEVKTIEIPWVIQPEVKPVVDAIGEVLFHSPPEEDEEWIAAHWQAERMMSWLMEHHP